MFLSIMRAKLQLWWSQRESTAFSGLGKQDVEVQVLKVHVKSA